MSKSKHNKTPLYTALEKYALENLTHFDVPGHKKIKSLGGIFSVDLLAFDANSTKELDMLSNPSGIIAEAEELMAEAYGADYAFMLVNGSTFGVQAMIMASVGPKEKIIMPRNVHKSAINGVILSGAIPIFIEPEIDYEYGIANGIDYETVKRTIKENPDVKALLVVNPTYFGAVSDLKSIISLCHRKNITVLVDEAHGAHFPFGSFLPYSSSYYGADLCTVSMHKTGGSLTQSSVLLLNEYHYKRHEIRAVINLMQTTSASYLLMASMDLARRELVLNGERIYDELYEIIMEAKAQINKIDGLSCITSDKIDGKGIFDYDETKIVVKVNELGFSGFEAYDILKNEYNVQMELAETYCVLAVVGIGDNRETIFSLVQALEDLSKKYYKKKPPFTVEMTEFFERPKTVITPRDAFFTPQRLVKIEDAVGEICGESIMIYPPGIPLIIPGERISKNIVKHYWFYVNQNCVMLNDEEDVGFITILGEA